ncbi:MAG: S8 family serine peptidase [Pirellulales bacterium]|nr:S8 family serine peptidase [Pirellulales bacterium]
MSLHQLNQHRHTCRFLTTARALDRGRHHYRHKICHIELLEDRQLLSADFKSPFFEVVQIGDNEQNHIPEMLLVADYGTDAPCITAIERAFDYVSDLSQYSADQLTNSTRWIVHTCIDIGEDTLAESAGVDELESTGILANTFIYRTDPGETADHVIAHFEGSEFVDYFYPLISIDYAQRTLVNDPYVSNQWHLQNVGQQVNTSNPFPVYGTWGADASIEPAWDLASGDGIIIGIVDDGFQYTHPDLFPRYEPWLSYDFVGDGDGPDNDPMPALDSDFHGTATAGIVAAAGDNGLGTAGIAYNATLAALRLLGQPFDDLAVFQALTHEDQQIDIYNNSWGPPDTRLIAGPGPLGLAALHDSVSPQKPNGEPGGRGGLGTIHVWAAGNGAMNFDNVNYDGYANHRYTIAVGASTHANSTASYSEGGAAILVVAPSGGAGGGIVTTDLVGEDGYNQTGYLEDQNGGERDYFEDIDYTSTFGGTSAAAPIVSGIVALMLEVNPTLTYRDIEHILVRSAGQIDPNDPAWQANWDPIFFDPWVNDQGLPWLNDTIPPYDPNSRVPYAEPDLSYPYHAGSALLPLPENGPPFTDQHAPTDPIVRTGSGFLVHDGQDYGYGHGAVDANMALMLAQHWQNLPPERFLSTGTISFSDTEGLIPAAESVDVDGKNVPIPGGLGGVPGFSEFFDLWLNPPKPNEDLDDPLPKNTRGKSYAFSVDDNLSIEYIEIRVDFDLLPVDASDQFRLTLVSPDGVHSDLTNCAGPDTDRAPLISSDGLRWTFTTNRHWGERTGGNATVYDADSDSYIARPWHLEIANWSDENLHLHELEITFYGIDYTEVYESFGFTDDERRGGRIQGIAGLDINGDNDFNFTGLLTEDGDFVRNPTEPLIQDGEYVIDSELELPASGAIIYVDLNKDGVLNDAEQNVVDLNLDGIPDIIEPFFVTGADGNYYFDLPYCTELPNGTYETYTIRQEPPPGTTINVVHPLFSDSYSITLLPDDPTTPELEHRELAANFLYTPSPITFSGNVYTNIDANGAEDNHELGIPNFVVFIDSSGDGVLQYRDVNLNMLYDIGIDIPLEPVAVTEVDGSYLVSISVGDYGFTGRDDYTLMLRHRDGWSPIEPEDICCRLFLETGVESAYYRLFVEAGADITFDFEVAPKLSSVTGLVFADQNGDGIFDSGTEFGTAGITVFLDQNGNGICDGNELASITDEAGLYGFFNLEPDHYELRLALQDGGMITFPASPHGGHFIDLVAGGKLVGIDFGFQLAITPDFNSNGLIDDQDLEIWQDGFGITEGATLELGDADSDRDVDGNDFLLWQQGYGTSDAAEAQASGLRVATTAAKQAIPFDLALSESGRISQITGRNNARLFRPDRLARPNREWIPTVIEDEPRDHAIREITRAT